MPKAVMPLQSSRLCLFLWNNTDRTGGFNIGSVYILQIGNTRLAQLTHQLLARNVFPPHSTSLQHAVFDQTYPTRLK